MTEVIRRQPQPIRRPLTLHRFRISLTRVADVTADALADLGMPVAALTGEDWLLPSTVGGAASWLGMAGLLVPSARHAAANLVLYPGNVLEGDVLSRLRQREE